MAAAVLALIALMVLALWRGRLVSVALAASECPDCRVPFVRVRTETEQPWEILACPQCDRVVTTVASLPSPVAECPACKQRSLVVYAERAEGSIVVDEWCDLCARRARTTVGMSRVLPAQGAPGNASKTGQGPQGQGADPQRMGRVLPFRKEG